MKQLQNDEFIGAIKLAGTWKFLAGTLGEWTLNYDSYDSDFRFSDESLTFRNGLTMVDETNAEAYYEAMKQYEFSEDQVRQLVAANGADKEPLMFVVDFDNRTFVSGYFDYPIENYAPKGWKSYYGNTYEYVPEHIRALWDR